MKGISCQGIVTLKGSFRVAVTGVCMPRLNFFVAGFELQSVIFEGSLAKKLRF